MTVHFADDAKHAFSVVTHESPTGTVTTSAMSEDGGDSENDGKSLDSDGGGETNTSAADDGGD